MAHFKPRTVLIVEDESIVAHDIQRTLADLGYDAFAIAATAEEALARAAEKRPDIVLMDVRIKGRVDGIKAAQLLQDRFGVPIVYLTAHADDATLDRAKQTRPSGYLLKPIKPAELRSAIEIGLYTHETRPAERETPASVPRVAAARPAPARPPGVRMVRRQVEQILGSPDFDAARRSREFLRFIVEEALAGRGESLTQSAIATKVFGRKDDFDAVVDPIVRIQAGRLRRSLERYYLLSGRQDPVRIELPRGGYVPAFQGAPAAEEETTGAAATPGPAPSALLDDWPAVVVSRFESGAPGTELEHVASVVNEGLTVELARYHDVRVVLQEELGRPESTGRPGARFGLEGRVRPEDAGWQVAARLVDRTTGEQVWGDKYHTTSKPGRWSGSPDDIARVIAARVGAEEGVIVQLLAAEHRQGSPARPTPYDAILRSYDFFLARDPATLAPAVEALRRVVAREPECGLAWTRLSRLYTTNYSFEVTTLPTPIDDAIAYAQNGVRVNPTSRRARCVLAAALLVTGELAAAREELEQALRLSPDSLIYLEVIGFLLTLLGDWERGPALARSARERNPHCLAQVQLGLWADHLRRGEMEAAYRAALDYRDPTFFWRSMMRASCLGHLGRESEANAEVAELLRRKPDFPARGRILLGHWIKFPEVTTPVVEGLEKAGLTLG